MSLWPPNSDHVAIEVPAFMNKERLEVSKGQISLLSSLAFLLLSISLDHINP
jgi:hypothetical protein